MPGLTFGFASAFKQFSAVNARVFDFRMLKFSIELLFGVCLAPAPIDLEHLMYKVAGSFLFNIENELNFSPMVNVTSSEQPLSISNTFTLPSQHPRVTTMYCVKPGNHMPYE